MARTRPQPSRARPVLRSRHRQLRRRICAVLLPHLQPTVAAQARTGPSACLPLRMRSFGLGLVPGGRWSRPSDLTGDSVLAVTAWDSSAGLSLFNSQGSSLRRSRFTTSPSPVSTTNTWSSNRLGPAHVEHDQIAVASRRRHRVTRHPAHTSHAPGAPLRPAPTAPPTPPSPWSRPTRARRTRPRIGRSPRTVRPRLAFSPSTDAPAGVRAGGADLEFRYRSAEGYSCWRSCVHRGLRSSRRPDRRTDPVLDSRKRPILKGGRHALHDYRHHHRDVGFWPAARTRTRRRWRLQAGARRVPRSSSTVSRSRCDGRGDAQFHAASAARGHENHSGRHGENRRDPRLDESGDRTFHVISERLTKLPFLPRLGG